MLLANELKSGQLADTRRELPQHANGAARRPPRPYEELASWKRALAEGFRSAGQASQISALTKGWPADSAFAY
ncbi:hypothetical protein [Streptomyces sp. NBC_00354]|nr:hypothetical protein OG296_05355 [Streptomyces sp. NBC_01001]